MNNYPMGADLVRAGKCPLEQRREIACMFCLFGHLTECHYPKNCEEAKCSHFETYKDLERGEGGL